MDKQSKQNYYVWNIQIRVKKLNGQTAEIMWTTGYV